MTAIQQFNGTEIRGMPHQTLVDKLYAEIAVVCEVIGCGRVFLAHEAARDPVEPWAVTAAADAESQGWSVTNKNSVVCPWHRECL